ncbi:YciI family protein [Promicromonospora sukumoe]|uniref:YciI family protein n=1 Tax=Promicromonospora sukumoe TaxID=88382 RepID=UPI003646B01C
MKYLILMQINPTVLEQLTPEQSKQVQDGHEAFMAHLKERGEFVGTQALADPSQSKVVRSVAGTPQTSDGPFAEAKEFLGGFYLVDVEDEARVLELARMIPDTSIDGLAVEVRPVMFSDLGDS